MDAVRVIVGLIVCVKSSVLIGQLRLGMNGDYRRDLDIRRSDAILQIVHKIKSTFHGQSECTYSSRNALAVRRKYGADLRLGR